MYFLGNELQNKRRGNVCVVGGFSVCVYVRVALNLCVFTDCVLLHECIWLSVVSDCGLIVRHTHTDRCTHAHAFLCFRKEIDQLSVCFSVCVCV